jgi:RNA recognition motif-containing protein
LKRTTPCEASPDEPPLKKAAPLEAKSARLFLRDLLPKHDKKALSEYFSKWGSVAKITTAEDLKKSSFQGSAIVTYRDPESCDSVLSVTSHVILGETISVKRAVRKTNTNAETEACVDTKVSVCHLL